MQSFRRPPANYWLKAELLIVTRAFLIIEYKTNEILGFRHCTRKAQSYFVSDRRKIYLHQCNLSCLYKHRIYVTTGIKSKL